MYLPRKKKRMIEYALHNELCKLISIDFESFILLFNKNKCNDKVLKFHGCTLILVFGIFILVLKAGPFFLKTQVCFPNNSEQENSKLL